VVNVLKTKASILTLHNQVNYGGVLQAFALQRFLFAEGIPSEIVDYWCTKHNKALTGGYLNSELPSWYRFCCLALTYFRNGFLIDDMRRRKRTILFIRNKLVLSAAIYRTGMDLEQLRPEGCLVVGSDQVWNFHWHCVPNPFLAGFLKSPYRRIAYAASFGIKEIPANRVDEYRSSLLAFDAISVREREGVLMVRTLTGVDAEYVLDPTLLISRSDWLAELSPEKAPQESYLLCYWLGDLFRIYRILLKLSRERDLTVRIYGDTNLLKCSCGSFKSILCYWLIKFHPRISLCLDAGPLDFLAALRDAERVVTDSFHGLLFSAIFNKPVAVILDSSSQRESISSRIQDFVSVFGLEAALNENLECDEISFAHTESFLLSEGKIGEFRRKSGDFLKRHLK